eukprot:1180114-Prorocentrum_minimum.AAC.4
MEELARVLEIPCFALETSKIDWGKCDSIERVASELLLVVKEVAPEGPVLLGGLGFGCRVAFEMAVQVQAERGGEVRCSSDFSNRAQNKNAATIEKKKRTNREANGTHTDPRTFVLVFTGRNQDVGSRVA